MVALDRRRFLGLVASVSAASLTGLSGCLSGDGGVEVLYAGSLNRALEKSVGPAFEAATGAGFRGEPRGSVAAVRLVEERHRSPDVIVSAESRLVVDRLLPEFADSCTEFVSNELVVAVRDGVELGGWEEAFFDTSFAVGISDPDLDPLGYRAVMMLQLAEQYTGDPGFGAVRDELLVFGQETELVASLDTGQLDAGVVYRNMAVGHGLDFVELPPEVNLGDPAHADLYADASFESDRGEVFRGRPIVYGASVLRDASNPSGGREFLEFVTEGEGVTLLRDEGFRVPNGLPREVVG